MQSNEKVSIEYCKRILNKNGNKYTDEQVTKIRDFFYRMAEIDYKIYKKKQQKNEAQKSNLIH